MPKAATRKAQPLCPTMTAYGVFQECQTLPVACDLDITFIITARRTYPTFPCRNYLCIRGGKRTSTAVCVLRGCHVLCVGAVEWWQLAVHIQDPDALYCLYIVLPLFHAFLPQAVHRSPNMGRLALPAPRNGSQTGGLH